MGMSLNSGGHLTHGSKASVSGKWFNALHYEVDKETGLIDYENVEKNIVLDVNEDNPDESSLTIVTISEVNGIVTENTEKCYGSKAELLLKMNELKNQ